MLFEGRGLKATGRYKRFRDLYCVIEVDHVHKARTVVRSGGLNFDWDERFQLDLLNNMEVNINRHTGGTGCRDQIVTNSLFS